METIFIQIPAALYAAIYERYGEQTSSAITSCLSRFISAEKSEEVSSRREAIRYSRPGTGTITGKVWEIADQIRKQQGKATREEVIKACMEEGININTASTQYSYWRKANP